MTTYYNEIEPYAVEWLKNLICDGHISFGVVDDRDIRTLDRNVATGFVRAHYFAGIAGWDYALQLAGWPDDRPVWTGSCPCQPFSVAGKRKGNADERHLWPVWYEHIKQCRPPTIFGEQVSASVAARWLDAVLDDLESQGYACAAAILPACSVGAPHRRDRFYFVANSDGSDKYRRHSSVQDWRRQGKSETAPFRHNTRTEWSIESRPATLAYGLPARVEQCCAYGNAIVPQVAAEFIKAFLDAELEHDSRG